MKGSHDKYNCGAKALGHPGSSARLRNKAESIHDIISSYFLYKFNAKFMKVAVYPMGKYKRMVDICP